MTGIRFLLDTNFIIGIIGGNEAVLAILSEKTMTLAECAYSFITRIELGNQSIMQTEAECLLIERKICLNRGNRSSVQFDPS